MSKTRIHPASTAFASDGSILANVAGYAGETDPAALLRRAIEFGGEIFIGVKLRGHEARDVLSRIEDAGHEGVGAAFVGRERRRKKRAARADKAALTRSKQKSR